MNSSRLILLLCLGLLAAAAAASSSPLRCSVTREPGGAFRYQLSQPHRSICHICWEDDKKIVIVHDRSHNATLVQVQTNQTIWLKVCLDFLRYTKDCDGVFEETNCSVNCSRLSDHEVPTQPHKNLICVTQEFCLDQLVFGLGLFGISAAIAAIAAIAAGVCLCVRKRRRSRTKAELVSFSRGQDADLGGQDPELMRINRRMTPPMIC